MRRRLLLLSVFVAAVVIALVVALGSGGSNTPDAPVTVGAAIKRPPRATSDPLPTARRAQVVEPVAGETAATEATAPVPVEAATDQAPTTSATHATHAQTVKSADSGPTSDTAVSQADVLKNGIALPPIEAPGAVREIIEAGNYIARTPYLWGGGHGKWLDKGYDCSGSISYALARAGLLNAPLDSGRLMSWGAAGKGKWVTIFANTTHVYMVVAGVRFDTAGTRTTGSRWQSTMRPGGGFVERHPVGL